MKDNPAAPAAKRSLWWRPVLLLAVIATTFILGHLFGLGDRMGDLRDWIESLGPWGPVAFVILYTAAVIAAIPGSLLTVAAGAMFGSLLGVILVSIASTLGASIDFLIARYFAREAIARWLSKNEKFRTLDRLAESRGAIVVALTRLVPIFPFNLLNYGFGLTAVPFRTYVFWSWFCMLPGTVLYVAGADAVFSGIAQGGIPWGLIVAIVIAGGLLAVLIRFARQRLNDAGAAK